MEFKSGLFKVTEAGQCQIRYFLQGDTNFKFVLCDVDGIINPGFYHFERQVFLL